MPNDVQTNLTIALQTKGFDKGMRDMLGVSQKSLDGLKKQSMEYGKVQEKIGGMQAKIQDLAKTQLDASKQMEKITDKTSDAFKTQSDRMEDARQQAEKLRKEVTLLGQAHKADAQAQQQLVQSTQQLMQLRKQEQQQGRWAGTQGLMQGMGVGGMAGMFMQRGPGFWRQAAGQQVGGMLRRAGGAAQGMAFGGIGGLQQALQAIPGGGILAGQLGAVAGHSQKALQWQRERLQMAPMVSSETDPISRKRMTDIDTQLAISRKRRRELDKSIAKEAKPTVGAGMVAALGVRESVVPTFLTHEEQAQDPKRMRTRGLIAENEALKSREKSLQVRRQEIYAKTPMGQIAGAGRRLLGLGKQESAQQAAQLMQVAGGRFTGEAGQARGVEAAMAAQTMFGVGPEAAGGFLQAGRRGGLVGGRGKGAEALTEALGDALAMGLGGSEITRYMQQTAQGIQSFQTTGIPFNKDSIKSMTLEIGKAGVGGVRGAAMAGGLQRYVQGIGQRGITGGMDLMMMQAFGGFKGGGPQAYEQAILQMESMQGMGSGGIEAGTATGDLIKRLVEMGGGAKGGGVTFMRKAMGRAGMQMSLGEAMAMTEKVTGEQLLTTQQREAFAIDKEGEARRMGAGGAAGKKIQTVDQLVAAAARRVTDLGPNLKKQASIMDQQLAVGSKLLDSVQILEQSSINLNFAFEQIAGPTIKKFATGMESVTAELSKLLKEDGLLGVFSKLVFG